MPRLAVALVWLYQGLWCKVLARCPGHRAIVESVPWLGESGGAIFLTALGLAEAGLAVWVLSGWRPRWAAGVQTVLLVAMNGGGLLWGREHIAEPGAMITQNVAFLTLVWLAAGRAARRAEGGSPWGAGRLDGREGPPQLLFGRMFEDWRVEEKALPPGGRVFCIASSGDTARALAARGDRVTAVDVNPAQVEYARERGRGAPARPGLVDRRMAQGRRFLGWLGMRERDRRAFLELDSPEDQARFWRDRFETRRFRAALRCALSPLVLRVVYGEAFVRFLPPASTGSCASGSRAAGPPTRTAETLTRGACSWAASLRRGESRTGPAPSPAAWASSWRWPTPRSISKGARRRASPAFRCRTFWTPLRPPTDSA